MKKRPKQYFNPKENWKLDEVLCFYKSVNIWNRITIPNLLNNIIRNNIIQTKAIAPLICVWVRSASF